MWRSPATRLSAQKVKCQSYCTERGTPPPQHHSSWLLRRIATAAQHPEPCMSSRVYVYKVVRTLPRGNRRPGPGWPHNARPRAINHCTVCNICHRTAPSCTVCNICHRTAPSCNAAFRMDLVHQRLYRVIIASQFTVTPPSRPRPLPASTQIPIDSPSPHCNPCHSSGSRPTHTPTAPPKPTHARPPPQPTPGPTHAAQPTSRHHAAACGRRRRGAAAAAAPRRPRCILQLLLPPIQLRQHPRRRHGSELIRHVGHGGTVARVLRPALAGCAQGGRAGRGKGREGAAGLVSCTMA